MPLESSDASANEEDFDQLGVRSCGRVPDGFPNEWRDLSFSVGVGLILTGYNCVYESFFNEYAASSVEQAVAMMVEQHEIPLVYHFFVDGLNPAFAWDADWSLLRRNGSKPAQRQLVQGAEPYRWHWDRTFFEIR